MNFLLQNNFKRTAILFLILGLFSFYVLSIVTMVHMNTNTSENANINNISMSHNEMNHQEQSPQNDCVSYHLGLLHNLSEFSFTNLGVRSLAVLLLVFFGFTFFYLLKFTQSYFSKLRIRFRQLYEKTVTVFALQLGYWLTLLEKRDPSCAFAIA